MLRYAARLQKFLCLLQSILKVEGSESLLAQQWLFKSTLMIHNVSA